MKNELMELLKLCEKYGIEIDINDKRILLIYRKEGFAFKRMFTKQLLPNLPMKEIVNSFIHQVENHLFYYGIGGCLQTLNYFGDGDVYV